MTNTYDQLAGMLETVARALGDDLLDRVALCWWMHNRASYH